MKLLTRGLAFAALFSATPLFAAVPNQREILIEFADLLAIPNLASDAPNIQRNADAIVALFAKRKIAARKLQVGNAPPIVVADLPAPGAKQTIAFYAHYDGQPVDKSKWKSDPWTPVMRDARGNDVDWKNAQTIDPEWRLYARSSGDDKAPIIAMLAAIDLLRAQKKAPKVNLRFIFEGEEEAGSPHLAEYLAAYPDVLRPDAWIICDGPVHQSRRMQLFFGARGVVDLELTLYGPIKGLHDGHYGNWVPNPIVRLTHLIDSMRDENGRILINGFYDQVRAPNAAEREALSKVPPVEDGLRREFQIGSTEADPLNERIMLPCAEPARDRRRPRRRAGLEHDSDASPRVDRLPSRPERDAGVDQAPRRKTHRVAGLHDRPRHARRRDAPRPSEARARELGQRLPARPHAPRPPALAQARLDPHQRRPPARPPPHPRRQRADVSLPTARRHARHRLPDRQPRQQPALLRRKPALAEFVGWD